MAKQECSEWNTKRCSDCEHDGVVYMGLTAVHYYDATRSDSGRDKWRACLNSRRFRDDIKLSKEIPSEEAEVGQMFFEEPDFGYEGQKLTTQMRPSGLIEITSPVAAKEETASTVSVAGLVNINHTLVQGPPPIARETQVRRVRYGFAQGMELTRRPDKNGR